ncbi:similar to Saccharomyces cerevisiae YDL125C HNT1 Adenosine 5'-monophosphoramidase [Maudiozyma saulgeensis]|uniref:Similar to Saccharomyces cerevisiae YDL125C HNT1 Adenosine 5'-monophosphoramidase n=1 Tax=Maudiozyma saulgeensis TaxID=1789683 RepID=A0A1X7QYM6_9SACH|nr:similar to Saccharomyces cerevisiae YDL125C HNT1 Adenosine 5'-monophosphoramidase [Kazachstania saulgeensis]
MSKTAAAHDASCIFCKIIKGEIPSFKLYETAHVYTFLDIQPTAAGHTLIIPKYHGAKLTDIPDEYLQDVLPVTKKLVKLLQLDVEGQDGIGYNLLQNNGKIAHQEVPHVHFHLIPKRDAKTGLGVEWPAAEPDFETLGKLHKELLAKLENAE